MNGIYQDGIDNADNFELTPAEFDAAFIHEFGHFSGLTIRRSTSSACFGCGADNLAGLPTMFPFLMHVSQGSLSTDDIAWISRLYPASGASGFAATHGTISGHRVLLRRRVARAVRERHRAPRRHRRANEDRRIAVSGVAGNRFRAFVANPITNPPTSVCPPSGSLNPGHIGLYEIPCRPAATRSRSRRIDPSFTGGSSVGRRRPDRACPGTAPRADRARSQSAAGQTDSGNHVTLIGTPPRFDQFEGP